MFDAQCEDSKIIQQGLFGALHQNAVRWEYFFRVNNFFFQFS